MDGLKTLLEDHGPFQADEEERTSLRLLERLLTENGKNGVTVSGSEGQQVDLPESARRLLRVIAHSLGRGEAVKVVPYQPMLSSFGMADLLNVSIAEAEQLLDEGQVPFTHAESNHRRVRFQDVMAYKQQRDAERRAGLIELIRMSEELGLYDDDDAPGPARREHMTNTAPVR